MDKRLGRVEWGPNGTRQRTSEAYWRQPLKWDKEAQAAGERHRVFCASLADVFEDNPSLVGWRVELMELIKLTPNLDWLLLTKRPEVAVFFLEAFFAGECPENIWLGTSVENQEAADERIPKLARFRGTKFLSCEPMLGLVDLCGHVLKDEDGYPYPQKCINYVDWVIVGGESGKNARPMHPTWAESIRDQCNEAGIPFFFKQRGEWTTVYTFSTYKHWLRVEPKHGRESDILVDIEGRMLSDHYDMGAATYPVAQTRRVGKKKAGRRIQGREWNEIPSTQGGSGEHANSSEKHSHD